MEYNLTPARMASIKLTGSKTDRLYSGYGAYLTHGKHKLDIQLNLKSPESH